MKKKLTTLLQEVNLKSFGQKKKRKKKSVQGLLFGKLSLGLILIK